MPKIKLLKINKWIKENYMWQLFSPRRRLWAQNPAQTQSTSPYPWLGIETSQEWGEVGFSSIVWIGFKWKLCYCKSETFYCYLGEHLVVKENVLWIWPQFYRWHMLWKKEKAVCITSIWWMFSSSSLKDWSSCRRKTFLLELLSNAELKEGIARWCSFYEH